jgi:hypothetical protein
MFQPGRYRSSLIPALVSCTPLSVRGDEPALARAPDVHGLLMAHPDSPGLWRRETAAAVEHRRSLVQRMLSAGPANIIPAASLLTAQTFACGGERGEEGT